jgi:hypothetical protein
MAAGGNDQQQASSNVSGDEAGAFPFACELDGFAARSAVEVHSRRDELTVELTRAGLPPELAAQIPDPY